MTTGAVGARRWSGWVRLATLALLLGACSDAVGSVSSARTVAPTEARSPSTSPNAGAPAAGLYRISGLVSEVSPQGTRPVAGAIISVWVDRRTSGFHLGNFTSNELGRYSISGIPESSVVLFASINRAGGSTQPRAAFQTLSTDAIIDIQLSPAGAEVIPADPAADGPSLSGVVFESDGGGGRRPVAGATVYFEWRPDLVTATTTSDAAGRYWLGKLPTGMVGVAATKPGYQVGEVALTFTASATVDLELKRK